MKRCLVTGASGLIGSRLIRLLAPRWEVHALSRAGEAERIANVTWHRIDLSRPLEARRLPEGEIDAVVYLAQSEAFREFPDRATEVFAVNTASVLQLLDYARNRGVKRFVFGSSGGVYGAGAADLSENASVTADSNLGFYLGTKLCSEVLVRNYAALMSTVILRFFFVYGPGQRQTMLIPRLVQSVRNGTPVVLQGTEGIRLTPTYVDDAAEAVARALEVGGSHTINVAGAEALSLREICEAIGAAVGRRPVFERRAGEVRNLVGDIRKMRELLVAPQVRFDEGLRRLLGTAKP